MNCQELAGRIERLQPDAAPRDVARLCLLLANHFDDLDRLGDDRDLTAAWQQLNLRVQAATDQHAAMTAELDELDELARGAARQAEPQTLSGEQVWTLVRAIKVQSRILQLYVGPPCELA